MDPWMDDGTDGRYQPTNDPTYMYMYHACMWYCMLRMHGWMDGCYCMLPLTDTLIARPCPTLRDTLRSLVRTRAAVWTYAGRTYVAAPINTK